MKRDLNDPAGVWLLTHGIKNLLRCDSAEVVSGIAEYVMSQHRVLGVGASVMDKTHATPLPAVMATLGAATRFLEVREPRGNTGIAFVARLSNERRALEDVREVFPELVWTQINLKRPPDGPAVIDLVRSWKPREIARVARLLHRRYEFFKVLRAIELIGYYTRYLHIFQQSNFELAVMSSHSNPHGIAFNLAARRCGIPVVLISHGMPVRPVARLDFDLALVHCEQARRTYVEEGCTFKQALVHGRRQDFAPFPSQLPDQLKIGLFLCKDVNEERFKAIITQLLTHPQVSKILIRPHPKNLWRGLEDWIAGQNNPRVSLSRDRGINTDLHEVDLVLGGNSSVLVDAVTAGKPAAFVPELDYAPIDMHNFVRDGLIFRAANDDLSEVHFDPNEILRFYKRPGYIDVLRLFANIDVEESVVLSRFADAMRVLVSQKRRCLKSH